MNDVVANIDRVCQELGQVELGGIRLEDANPSLLNVAEHDLDIHVSMHPSALAYYGALLADATRQLAFREKAYKHWKQRMYGEAKGTLSGGKTKPTVADIESEIAVGNEKEIEKWEKEIEEFQHQQDTLSVWFDAWKQKSYSLREYLTIEQDERKGGGGRGSHVGGGVENKVSESEKGKSQSIKRIRAIIDKNKKGN